MSSMMAALVLAITLGGCTEIVEVQGEPGARGVPGTPGEGGGVGEQGLPGEDGIECAVDPDTLTMQYEWVQAQSYRRTCWNANELEEDACQLEAKVLYESCMSMTDNQDSCMDSQDQDRIICDNTYIENDYFCDFYYAKRVNKIPLRVCGVRIFDTSSGALPIGEEGYHTMGVLDVDSDEDGISDWMEYNMGLNPCTPHSFGLCIDDADLDYDADGIPNGEDEYPICNPQNDPGEYPSDCV